MKSFLKDSVVSLLISTSILSIASNALPYYSSQDHVPGYSCEEYSVEPHFMGSTNKVRLCKPVTVLPSYRTVNSLWDKLKDFTRPAQAHVTNAEALYYLRPIEDQLQSVEWPQPENALLPPYISHHNDELGVVKRFTELPPLPYPLQSSRIIENRESNFIEPIESNNNNNVIGWQIDTSLVAHRLNAISNDVSTIKDSLIELVTFLKENESKQMQRQYGTSSSEKKSEPSKIVGKNFSPVNLGEPQTKEIRTNLIGDFIQEVLRSTILNSQPSTSSVYIPGVHFKFPLSPPQIEEDSDQLNPVEVSSADADDLQDADAANNENSRNGFKGVTIIKIQTIGSVPNSSDNNEGYSKEDALNPFWRRYFQLFGGDDDLPTSEIVTSSENKSNENEESNENNFKFEHEDNNSDEESAFFKIESNENEDSKSDEETASSEKNSSENEDVINTEIEENDAEWQAFLTRFVVNSGVLFHQSSSEINAEEYNSATSEKDTESSNENDDNGADSDNDTKENSSAEDWEDVFSQILLTTEKPESNNFPHLFSASTEAPSKSNEENGKSDSNENSTEVENLDWFIRKYNLDSTSSESLSENVSNGVMEVTDTNQAEEAPKQESSEFSKYIKEEKINILESNENESAESPKVDCDISYYTHGKDLDPSMEALFKNLLCPNVYGLNTSENASESGAKEAVVDSIENDWSYEE